MVRRFLETTHSSDLRPVIIQGSSVLASFAQLRRLIETQLGAEVASLLAEPRVDADRVDWFCRRDGEILQLSQCAPQQRQMALSDIDEFKQRVSVLAQQMLESHDLQRIKVGRMLEAIIDIPSQDGIYLVGDRAVVVGWGGARTKSVDRPEAVRRLGAKTSVASDRVEVPTIAPTHGSVLTAKRQTFRGLNILPRWWIWAVAGFLGVFVLVFGIGLMGTSADSLATERHAEDALRAQLADIQAKLASRRDQCPLP